MKYVLYDPLPYVNEYASKMFFHPMQAYGKMEAIPDLDKAKDVNVVILTDNLSEERIVKLKNNGCRIIAFNVTDSSYFSNAIRYAPSIGLIDHIFMVSGIAVRNEGTEFAVDPDFTIRQVDHPFLPDNEWTTYLALSKNEQLHSLPYVPWDPIPHVPWTSWAQRSKKVLLRGGGHSRRFILALFLMRANRLDCNSGMVLAPYFDDKMNPAFRYCDECRIKWRLNKRAEYLLPSSGRECTSPARTDNGWDFSNLGHWNNRCPASFYWMTEQFNKKYDGVDMKEVEHMLNAKWISDINHQQLLSRIAFTSDLKWIHSIYTPQRYWQGVAAGCVNILPERTADQIMFPNLWPEQDYLTFSETFEGLEDELDIGEERYTDVTHQARVKYEHWIKPSQYRINTNLLEHIFKTADK